MTSESKNYKKRRSEGWKSVIHGNCLTGAWTEKLTLKR